MLDVEQIVYSRIVAQMPDTIKTKYPNLNYTTSDRQGSTPKFPNVYVHMMPSAESAVTLDGTDIDGVLASFQIDVVDNEKQSNAKKVMDEVVKIMKSMHFEVTAMPSFENTPSVYRQVARFRRQIMALDKL